VGHQGHSYVLGLRGRSYRSSRDSTGTTFLYFLACSKCEARGERRQRSLMPPDQVDKKFMQVGWSLDPHICPACAVRAAQEKADMTSKPSPAAIKAQAKMFSLLATHFDGTAGAYGQGWSDQKIATDTGLTVDLVAEVRRETFGELQLPPEVLSLQRDVGALEALAREQYAGLETELKSLGARLADISKRYQS
jgi:hypothetical protein